MKRKSPSKPDSHSVRVRATWRQHLEAQRASGLKQSEYCRVHGLQPKYFSLWKRRLAAEGGVAAVPEGNAAPAGKAAPPLIPVTIKAEPPVAPGPLPKPKRGRPVASAASRDEAVPEALSIKARLPNGILLDALLPSRSLLPGFLSDLAGLVC